MIFAIRYANSFLDFVVMLVLTLIAVCISMVLHEVAHGLVAKWNGDYTAKYEGRLTLNPLKHFDLIGFVMLMFVGFGYAKPVPVNPYNFKHRTRGQVLVSIAGVTVNMILAFLSALGGVGMSVAMSSSLASGASEAAIVTLFYIFSFFSIMVSLNLSLVFFNILPIFPLDGFRLIESITKRGNKFCEFMRTNGRYILWGLVGLSFIVSSAMARVSLPYWFEYVDILGTYLNFFVSLFGGWFNSLWMLLF